MKLVVVLSGLAVVSGQLVGNVTALCQSLFTGYCNNTFPAGVGHDATTCATAYGLFGTPNGFDNETSGNTIGCRQHYALLASALLPHYCNFASILGGGMCQARTATGSLTAACMAIQGFCSGSPNSSHANVAACQTNLTALQFIHGSLTGTPSAAENSLECRIYHAAVGYQGAGSGPLDIHCSHTTTGLGQPCNAAVSTNAAHHCGLINGLCTGNDTQYNNDAQCIGSFNCFAPGPGVAATNNDDRSSRQYHAQAALSANVHCQHGGPSGGGVLTAPTFAAGLSQWLALANSTSCRTAVPYVPTAVAAAVTQWELGAGGLSTIAPIGNLSIFTIGANGNAIANTVSCRIYHLTVATVDPTHCTHGDVLGFGLNGCNLNITTQACLWLRTACPAYTGAATCEADVGALLAAGKVGNSSVMNPVDDSLACRLYQASVSLVQKKAAPAATPAQCGTLRFTISALAGTCGVRSSAVAAAASALLFLPALFV